MIQKLKMGLKYLYINVIYEISSTSLIYKMNISQIFEKLPIYVIKDLLFFLSLLNNRASKRLNMAPANSCSYN